MTRHWTTILTISLLAVLPRAYGGEYDFEGCGPERKLTDSAGRGDSPAGYSYPKFLRSGDRIVFVGQYSADGRKFRYSSVGLAGGKPDFYAESAGWSSGFYDADPAVHGSVCSAEHCVRDSSGEGPRWQNIILVTHRATGRTVPVSIGPGNHRAPSITPDGKKIIFSYNAAGRDDAFSLMIAGTDGSDAKVLVEGERRRHVNWLAAVSPDGRFVAYGKEGSYGPGYFFSDIYVKCLR
ncbi:MAG: PD40 domain-containing protein [Elusimicrobia bacterium]|nr:PD40 domain-containing protein [Elusimicrobiota bacterium]